MENNEDRYDLMCKDLYFQLSFESDTFDWDYFIHCAKECRKMQKKIHKEAEKVIV